MGARLALWHYVLRTTVGLFTIENICTADSWPMKYWENTDVENNSDTQSA